MTLTELDPSHTPVHPEIRERATVSSKAKYTRHYLALNGVEECAFVSMDLAPKDAVLYELWVPQAQRTRGVGTSVLKAVESLARAKGYKVLMVRPEPIDSGIDPDRLAGFYRRNGFKTVAQEPGLMRKDLTDG